MKTAINVGYWGAGPPPNAAEQFAAAERIGIDQVWTAEAYGSDAWTPLAWWGSRTSRVQLGTAVSQLSDTDYAAAITKLNTEEVSLQAAQESYASISQLSLFKYLQ